jgi:hypothetical protein
MVAVVLSTQPPRRKYLLGDKLVMWINLLSCLTHVTLSQEEDEFLGSLDQKGEFSVKSHYLGLINRNVSNLNKRIWKLKAPM